MVKPGYKQTEIGVIPEEWEIKNLPYFGSVISGGTPSTNVSEYWNGDIAWCTPSDITASSGTLIAKTEKRITEQGLSKSAAILLPRGSLLLCTRATIGDSKINVVPMATNQGFKNVVPQNCDVFYLYYLLQTKKKEMLEKAIGSTFLEISKSALCSIPLQYPKLPEQRRIAKALSDMDELIASLEKLIAKKKAIKQGVMQELLTGNRRLQGFSGEWERAQIRELGKIVGGGTPSTKNVLWWNGGIPWVSSSDLDEGNIHDIKMTRFITSEAINSSATCICPVNSILIVSRVGVGKVAVAPSELCTSQDFTNLILNDACSQYVAYALSNMMQKMETKVQGTSIKGVTAASITEMTIMLPSKEEQIAIATVLSDMDTEIKCIEQRLKKTQLNKQGMMQQLLTGKIRFV